MRVLVFGKTGQVASALAVQGDVISLGRDAADLAKPASCAAAIHAHTPDVVINAAAYTGVDAAEDEEALAHVINAEAPGAMAQVCAEMGLPFLHISTDYVFDGGGTRAWRETDEVAPQNAYGRSKLAGEEAVRAAGGQHAILRTAWVFSARGNNFVKTMRRLGESHKELRVVSDQIGCPTPAADIAAALMTMARAMQGGQAGGTYHFAGQPAVSWAEFARAIFEESGQGAVVHDIPSAEYPTPAARPLNSRLDCALIEADFGITPSNWRAGLADVVKELESMR